MAVMEDLFDMALNLGGLVIDLFAGSCTTASEFLLLQLHLRCFISSYGPN